MLQGASSEGQPWPLMCCPRCSESGKGKPSLDGQGLEAWRAKGPRPGEEGPCPLLPAPQERLPSA